MVIVIAVTVGRWLKGTHEHGNRGYLQVSHIFLITDLPRSVFLLHRTDSLNRRWTQWLQQWLAFLKYDLAVFFHFWLLEEKDRFITETHIEQQQKQPTEIWAGQVKHILNGPWFQVGSAAGGLSLPGSWDPTKFPHSLQVENKNSVFSCWIIFLQLDRWFQTTFWKWRWTAFLS